MFNNSSRSLTSFKSRDSRQSRIQNKANNKHNWISHVKKRVRQKQFRARSGMTKTLNLVQLGRLMMNKYRTKKITH